MRDLFTGDEMTRFLAISALITVLIFMWVHRTMDGRSQQLETEHLMAAHHLKMSRLSTHLPTSAQFCAERARLVLRTESFHPHDAN